MAVQFPQFRKEMSVMCSEALLRRLYYIGYVHPSVKSAATKNTRVFDDFDWIASAIELPRAAAGFARCQGLPIVPLGPACGIVNNAQMRCPVEDAGGVN